MLEKCFLFLVKICERNNFTNSKIKFLLGKWKKIKIIQQDLFEETFDVEIKWFFALGIAKAIMCEGICQGFCAKEKNLQLRGEMFVYFIFFFVISRIKYPTTMLRQFHFWWTKILNLKLTLKISFFTKKKKINK